MKVLYLTNLPSPYRVEFFNILSAKCELTVLYEKSSSNDRNKKWYSDALDTYEVRVLKGISTGSDSVFSFQVIKYLKRKYDIVVICGISSLTNVIAIEYCRVKKIPYYIEGDGGIVKSGKGIREKVKKYLITGAKGYLSTCKRHDDYYLKYGASKERIVRFKFSSIHEYEISKVILNQTEKKIIRNELGVVGNKVVLFVGQIIYRKGIDILIDAAKILPEYDFYVVGGLPTTDYAIQISKNKVENVHFVEFKTKDELIRFYDASDIFVLPTREDIWGLVINEAMARGLPVITTDNCNAGLEMVRNGVNGFIIPTNDKKALVDSILLLDKDTELYAGEALKTAMHYTLEEMVKNHVEIFMKDETIKD